MATTQSTVGSESVESFYIPAMAQLTNAPSRLEKFLAKHFAHK